jgi:SET domain-containing protein
VLLVPATVGISSIHGLGLIARQSIQAGTAVWRFELGFDLMVSSMQLRGLSKVAREQVEHYGFLSNDLNAYLLSSDDDRFTNHSARPNTTFVLGSAYATRDIAVLEEITADYRQFDASFSRRPFAKGD